MDLPRNKVIISKNRYVELQIKETKLKETQEKLEKEQERIEYSYEDADRLKETQAQLSDMREWIEDNCRHLEHCPKLHSSGTPCTCGLDSLLQKTEQPKGKIFENKSPGDCNHGNEQICSTCYPDKQKQVTKEKS